MKTFKRIKDNTPKPELTSQIAKDIYDVLATELSDTEVFKQYGYSFEDIATVKNEVSRIENEIDMKMSGRFVIEEGTPATYDEEGNELTPLSPAVYYTPSTKTDLKQSITSDLLNTNTVLDDYILWSKGTPEVSVSWIQFVNGYNEV